MGSPRLLSLAAAASAVGLARAGWCTWTQGSFFFIAVVLLATFTPIFGSSKASSRGSDEEATAEELAAGKHRVDEGMASPGMVLLAPRGAPPLLARDGEELKWFCETVAQIYEVNYIKMERLGEAGGDALDPWPMERVADAVKGLREKVKTLPTGTRIHEPLDDAYLARHLIATGLDVTEAFRIVKEYVSWRKYEVLGAVAPDYELLQRGVTIVPCEDRWDRPVAIVRMRLHQVTGNVDDIKRILLQSIDGMAMHMMQRRTAKFSKNNPLEQYVLIIDLKDCGWGNFDMAGFKAAVPECTFHYPNRVAQIFIIHAPMAFSIVWSMVSPFVHKRAKRKISILKDSFTNQALGQLIAPEQLPKKYGGKAANWSEPPLSTDLDDHAGKVLVKAWRRAGIAPVGMPEEAAIGFDRRLSTMSDGGLDGQKLSSRRGGESSWFACCASPRS